MTNKLIGFIPKEIQICYHSSSNFYEWVAKTENLFDENGNPRWIEHPQGKKMDVILLPLKNIDKEIKIYPFDLKLQDIDIILEISMRVCILGFPLGFCAGGNYPIWKTGHISSEPNLNYNGTPMFLIDATTKEGMSGAPVILRLNGGYKRMNGAYVLGGKTQNKFLGVYSGRIGAEADIGRVWKPSVINEIIEHFCLAVIK